MKYQQLTEGQRYQIALLYDNKFSCTDIARYIGVNKSTISRELRRNRTATGYEPSKAERLCIERRRSASKRAMEPMIIDFVIFALGWKWSPEQISGVAKILGFAVSHEWIYQYIYP